MSDLWPSDIKLSGIKAPVAILKEQASLLGEKTKNVAVATVEVSMQNFLPEFFAYDFFIIAPTLHSYRYLLFNIRHTVSLYPVTFWLDFDIRQEMRKTLSLDENQPVIAEDQEDFISKLGLILQAEKTKDIIRAIIAQAFAFETDTAA